eukprot:6212852-Pleurochrysis_carterae.AAC.5
MHARGQAGLRSDAPVREGAASLMTRPCRRAELAGSPLVAPHRVRDALHAEAALTLVPQCVLRAQDARVAQHDHAAVLDNRTRLAAHRARAHALCDKHNHLVGSAVEKLPKS